MAVMKMSGMKAVALAVAILLPPASTSAQSYWDVLTPHLNAIEFGRQNEQTTAQSRSDEDAHEAGDTATRENFDTSYTPSEFRTRQNLQKFVNRARAVDPASAARLERAFAEQDVLASMSQAMQTVGLSRNDVADAYALYFVNAWQVANGDDSTPSKQTMQAVSAQVAQDLLRSSPILSATDAQKQELAEALMIQSAMIAHTFKQMKGDKTQLKALVDQVKQGAKASGLTLDAVTLTEKGFVRVKMRAK